MKFRDLTVGDVFEFDAGEWGRSCYGPWRKISSRKYIRLRDGMVCRVGSINATVVDAEEEQPPAPPLAGYFADMADIRRRNPGLR